MRPDHLLFTALGAVTALVVLVACGGRDEPYVRSTLELMDDPILLQAVLSRCNESGDIRDPECRNARDAVARLEKQQPAEALQQRQAEVQTEFERAREQRRQREELERKRQEAQQNVNPYTMPLVPPMQGVQPPDESAGRSEPPST